MRRFIGLGLVLLALTATGRAVTQAGTLRILSASPQGNLGHLTDAAEVRITFSEAMVPLGEPSTTVPAWLSVQPPAESAVYWSGTRTLIVSPGGARQIPYGTAITIRVDASAQAVSGRRLGTPYTFTFTTPTARLMSAQWYRPRNQVSEPVIFRLRFNQPMDPATVLAHVTVAHEPHAWTAPQLSADERQRWAAEDAANLARFDARIAAINAVAGSSAPVDVRLARDWDRQQYPDDPTSVVLETTTVLQPGAWLRIWLDDSLKGTVGSVPHPQQATTLQLTEPFVIRRVGCSIGTYCRRHNPVDFSQYVLRRAFLDRLSIIDMSGPSPVAVPITPPAGLGDASGINFNLLDLGVPEQPSMHRWIFRIDESLRASDGQTLGYNFSQSVVAPHAEAYLGWDGAVWEASGGTAVQFVARNVKNAWIGAASMTAADILPTLNILRSRKAPMPPGAGELRPIGFRDDTHETHAVDLRPILGGRSTGLAWAHLAARSTLDPNDELLSEPNRSALIQVTNLGVSVKDSLQSTLILVTRLDTAAPVPGASVTIRDSRNQAIWSGTTRGDGTAMAPALPMRNPSQYNELTWVVTAEHDQDLAWVAADWIDYGALRDSQVRYDLTEATPVLRGSVMTDRGVYQPGEVVQFKALTRYDTPAGHVLVREGQELEAVLNDERGAEVSRAKVRVNRWSSAEWQFTLPHNASLGQYWVHLMEIRPPGSNNWRPSLGGRFLVGAFRRPDFRVDVVATAPVPILGSALNADTHARFLFGATMGPRAVKWNLRRASVIAVPSAIHRRYGEQDFVFGYAADRDSVSRLANVRTEGSGTLDSTGHLRTSMPVEANEGDAARLTFEAQVEGLSGQTIANRAETVMHPASLYVGVSRPPFLVDSKAGLQTRVVAADLEGVPVPGVAVHVELLREEWRFDDARYGYLRWRRVETPVADWTVTATSDGAPLHMPLPAGGRYIVRGTARDAAGRLTRTDAGFYAFGGATGFWKFDGNSIDLVPERKTWRPGETARVLVPSPWTRATALVTTEREGVRSHWTLELTSMQDTIEVPITSADIPNVYVSVLLLKGRTSDPATATDADPGRPDYRIGYAQLAVEDTEKRLAVTVRADRETYRPRETVRVSLDVSGAGGARVASEVTLWAVDHGVLSLTEYTIPDVARAIYADKALQVKTQDSRFRIMGRRPLTAAILGGRGGGAMAGLSSVNAPPPMRVGQINSSTVGASIGELPLERAGLSEEDAVRKDFRPLAFWLGSVTTDVDGRAVRTVTLPDNLTTYRIMAVASTAQSHFGSGEAEIRATQPLAMVPAFPRFMVTGDRASFGAVITNGTGSAGTADVTIERVTGGSVIVEGSSQQRIRVAAGESQPVRFDVRALDAGVARMRIRVRLGADTDAFEMPLPVYLPSKPIIVAAYGDTEGSATELIAVPERRLANKGGLTVSLASTALVGLGESARYLDDFEYECAEPVASKTLVRLLSADLDGAFGVGGPTPAAIRDSGLNALRDLTSFQCYDGGFGMFKRPCRSLPYLTAYVLDVLHAARALKAPVSEPILRRGYDYLQGQLRMKPPDVDSWPAWAATRAYILKVMAEGGRPVQKELAASLTEAQRTPIFALSFLADALAASGDRGPRYADVVRRIINATRIEADRAFVEEADGRPLIWLWHTNARATGVVLEGLARRADSTDLPPAMARWLLAVRHHGRWGTTHENGVALRALVAYYRAFEKEQPQMTVTAVAGGTAIASTDFRGRSTTVHSFTTPLERLGSAASTPVTISRTGTGRAYYTTRMEYVPEGMPVELSRGFRITRRYLRVADDGSTTEGTTFARGDVVRVVLQVQLAHEGRFVAITDQVPAGLEPIDGAYATTANDLAQVATQYHYDDRFQPWWQRGGFDHVEKRDERVVAYATRLAPGRHEITYLARAMTAGTFEAAGPLVEAIYTPEVSGRGAPARLVIR